jgi:uncharacterized membrane protein YkoI
MEITLNTNRSIRIRTIALLGGGVVAGAIGASALGASALTNGTASSTSSTSSTSSVTSGSGGKVHGKETVVTGTKAATLKANALKQVPGATVDRITTEDSSDSSGAAYEVHLTKKDGSKATLLFGSNLIYLSTETGDDHRGHGHSGGAGETAVTGTKATTLKAAALKQVPGASVDEVSTDSGDAAYEVHLTKPDGTHVTVKFDKTLKFVNVEDGRGN